MSIQVNELQSLLSIKTPRNVINDLSIQFQNNSNNNEIRFDLACALSKSIDKNDLYAAINHFKYLIDQRNQYFRDSMYHLALTYYVLNEYDKTLNYCEEIYRQEPDNEKIKQLHLAAVYQYKQKIRDDSERETALAITAGVGVAVLAVGVTLLFGSRKK
jgi:tetratricopeptide (TPR) repeat protein